jgi:hypothetical protein
MTLELKAEMSVFNLAQKRSFPPLCSGLADDQCDGTPQKNVKCQHFLTL